jgi:hypothetical protein
MAVSSLLFFAALLAVFDFGRMFYYQSRLKYAVSQSTRFATTGNVLDNPDDPGNSLSRADSIVAMIKQLSGFSGMTDSDITIVSFGSGGAVIPGAGGPGDVVSVTANYRIGLIAPYLTPLFHEGRWEFSATTTFRNEEFPDGQQAAIQAEAVMS